MATSPPEAPTALASRRPRGAALAGLALFLALYLAAYGASAGYGFMRDDFGLAGISFAEALSRSVSTQNLRPVWYLSYPLVDALFGPSALAHHLVNHALHLGNCALGFALLRGQIGPARAGLAVGLWSLLPQSTFPIVWIAQRNDLLMTLFVLAALLAQARGRRRSAGGLYLAGFLAKLTCLFVPLAWTSRRLLMREPADRRMGIALFALGVAGTLWAQQFYTLPAHLAALGPGLRIANMAKNFALGWGFVVMPLPFLAGPWLAAAWAAFLGTAGWLLARHFAWNPAARRLLGLAALASLPLALMSEPRVTYLMMLFLVAGLLALVDPAALARRRGSRALAMVALAALLAYALPATRRTEARFASGTFDISAPMVLPPDDSFYPADPFPALRDWQKRLLGQ